MKKENKREDHTRYTRILYGRRKRPFCI